MVDYRVDGGVLDGGLKSWQWVEELAFAELVSFCSVSGDNRNFQGGADLCRIISCGSRAASGYSTRNHRFGICPWY